MNVKMYVGLALLILAIVFIAQNAISVDIRFLFWKISMSRSLMVFFVLAIGIAIGWILSGHLRNKTD
jgi:putative membrane protein